MATDEEIRAVSLHLARMAIGSSDFDPIDVAIAACGYEQAAVAIIDVLDNVRRGSRDSRISIAVGDIIDQSVPLTPSAKTAR